MNGFPDALIFPESAKVGRSMNERVVNLAKRAESMMGLDYAAGERANIRQAAGGKIFVSPSTADSILFPLGHPRYGENRYVWSRVDGDVEVGFLLPE